MFSKLLIVFLVVPIVEMMLLIELGKYIGTILTVSIVVMTGLAGLTLAKIQGFTVLNRLRENMEIGISPEDEIIEGVIILGGALLLLTPGLVTDLFGFSCLFPFSRYFMVIWIRKLLLKHIYIQRHWHN